LTDIELKGEKLTLYAERAAFWHRESALLIADPHWGKAATFRAGGIPVPSGTTKEAIQRLESLVAQANPKKVIFLGDLLHAKTGRSKDMFEALEQWRKRHAKLDVILVRGNHDRRAGDPPPELCFDCIDAPLRIGPFALAHYPSSDPDAYVIAGHVHPAIRIHGRGRQSERLPCFFFGRDHAILPAFGDFTGLADVDPAETDRVYAIAEDKVVLVTISY
jgi:DNA ligase-associated metallophosphoesterase